MKLDRNADEKFEWDMTAVILLVMLIMFVLSAASAFGPLGHTT
jgi:hypothetical protein